MPSASSAEDDIQLVRNAATGFESMETRVRSSSSSAEVQVICQQTLPTEPIDPLIPVLAMAPIAHSLKRSRALFVSDADSAA